MKRIAVVATLLLSLIVVGCATIMHGTKQDVGISSNPSGAKVTIDNVPQGMTPVVAKLSRKDHHMVRIEMVGYQPYEATITRGVSGWVWGNIVFGGLIGLAVDAMTGGLYKLTPQQIQAELSKGKLGYYYKDNTLYVAVVLQPDTEWQKIGSLMPNVTQ